MKARMRSNYTGVSGSRMAYYIAQAIEKREKALIVVSSERAAERLKADLAFFDARPIFILPEEEELPSFYEARDRAPLAARIRGMAALVSGEKTAVIAPVSAVLRPVESKERFLSQQTALEVGMQMDPSDLRRLLVQAGYEPAPVTESQGEFSTRGGILDVFPPTEENPVRIEFFDDEIDSIRSYDAETQLSLENLTAVTIVPAAEFVPTEEERTEAWARLSDEMDKKQRKLEKGLREGDDKELELLRERRGQLEELFTEAPSTSHFADYLHYFEEGEHALWDYMEDGLGVLCDPARIVESVPENRNKGDLYRMYDNDTLFLTPFPETIKGVQTLDEIRNVRSRQVAPFNGQMGLFGRELRTLIGEHYHVILVTSSEDREKRIREYLEEAGIHGYIEFRTGDLSAGMVLEEEKLCYITEQDIFPNLHRSRRRAKRRTKKTQEFSDLHPGDYVVHEEHGIGRFEGIKSIETDGEIKDYLKIHYAGSDVLYIPTDQMDIVQRYIGNEGNAPRLSRLSGGDWRNTRAKARRAIEEIAEDLIKLYAEREMKGGYAFQPDTEWQRTFEDAFPYAETEDQLRAVQEIKEDMEKPLPMDRLLCGDVGYGKTEVAARAIFKCLAEGKQAVLLAPTTLLVNQHYHTLKERLQDFPFHIEMLSRFVSDAKQKEILEGLKRGSVDFVVGTHRLLSKDVTYKDLGLLVIDEEQRFGVKHKEQIKMLRQNVDVLTLSATPIPRTLSMSLTGIKSISTIDEPPIDRYPVQTFVAPEDDTLLKRAIERELGRGGQVYVIYNRVKGIYDVAKHIGELVPEARIVIGHGRMDETNLENVMVDFMEGEADIFVATTIIENGIDIPNANTIIILQADKFGLSQLYQLRGRVGRSNRLAYAYLIYQPQKVMTEMARKRLAAIREFTEFGAGFKLAMRDLELRGAGNVLGEAQHGHIAGIGYELYVKEIDRAVRRLQGETVVESRAEISIEIDIPARIPASYIEDETLRLQAYKKIAQIGNEEEAEDLVNELIDRYGDPPEMTLDLIRIAEIKCLGTELGLQKITERGGRLLLTLLEENNVDAYTLIMTKQQYGDRLLIGSGSNPVLTLLPGKEKPAPALLGLMKTLSDARKEGLAQAAAAE